MCTRKQQGFTLTELLIVMVIAAIMAMIALPNMSQWIASRRIASHAERIANLLRFSRGEAVRLNLPVYICPVQVKKDGTVNNKCDSGKKGQGMLAFGDKNGNKGYDNDTADVLLRSVVLNDDINDKLCLQPYRFWSDSADHRPCSLDIQSKRDVRLYERPASYKTIQLFLFRRLYPNRADRCESSFRCR